MKKILKIFPIFLLLFASPAMASEGKVYIETNAVAGGIISFAGLIRNMTSQGHLGFLHNQQKPEPVTPDLVEQNIGTSYWPYHVSGTEVLFTYPALGVNFYLDTNPSSNGYHLNSHDRVCAGKEVNLGDAVLSGEWFTKGGPMDSPPVYFTDDIDKVKEEIDKKTFDTEVYDGYICIVAGTPATETGAIFEENVKRCFAPSQFVCEPKCDLVSSGQETGKKQTIGSEGQVYFVWNCTADCILFVNRKDQTYQVAFGSFTHPALTYKLKDAYGYMKFSEPFVLNDFLELKAEKSSAGPKLTVIPYLPENPPSKFTARVEVENTGDTTAYIDKLEVTNAEFKILYSPEKLEPDEKTEILLEITPANNRDIGFRIEYSSETLGCLAQKEFSASVSLKAGSNIKGICSSDMDCPVGETCCVGTCRNSRSGVCDDIDGDGEPDTWVEV
jgi:hypothetical protein